MRAVIQRVRSATVRVEERVVGTIERGLLVLLGVQQGDEPAAAEYLAEKTLGLRIFPDGQGKMNLDVQEVRGSVLVVSQFTLLGDCRKGRRPSFIDAAPPEIADRLYQHFASLLEQRVPVARGEFQADMQVALINDGPVTILLDSRKLF